MSTIAKVETSALSLNELTATEITRLTTERKASCEEVAERDAQAQAWEYLAADSVIE